MGRGVCRLDQVSETILERNFMKGLKPDIRGANTVMRLCDLREAMELAQLMENQRHLEREARGRNSRYLYRMATTFLTPKRPTSSILKGPEEKDRRKGA
ncbi:hypothetical protein MA16_Dca001536 [Dendrobium catenatum]|uniref:Uncharacterized protein n=1 Tax=Dendrobium catenatum TaxID=906689 RepID=A0A2I0WMP1_9ASPA|nr:hypothetical protein MA16_Dca001536 [Dendrobium catenatum]